MALGERGVSALVIDYDLSGRLSSSELNAGGVRATWWQPVNIALCRSAIRYYESISQEVGFRQKGYLWLYDERTWPGACEHLPLQRSLDHPIEILTADQVARRVPEIDRLDGIAGATFSPADGLINPNLLKEHYRRRSRELGVRYLDRTAVVGAEAGSHGVRLRCRRWGRALGDDELAKLMTGRDGVLDGAEVFEVRAGLLVVAAGAWSGEVLRMLGLDCPGVPVRRQICIVDCRATNLSRYGMIVDTSGLYCHNEATHILAGYSPPEEPPGYDFRYDGEGFFNTEIWPRLYARMSCMERLRHVGGWAGLYAVTPDRSAVVGRAGAKVFEAHSFSGRGVMQSYGAGQALGELIVRGRYEQFDASALSRDRFTTGALVPEELHI